MYDDDLDMKPAEDGGEPPAWMLTFADLVSLLICFFVLLYSMKSVDESIWQKVTGSFAGALNYSQKFKQVSPNNESGVDAERILNADGMEYIESVLYTKFDKEGLSNLVGFKRNPKDNSLHITVPGKYMFEKNTAKLTEDGKSVLTFITETVQYINDDLEVANYVEPSITGRSMQASIFRSLAVRDFILRKGSKKTIKVVGYGSEMYESMQDIMSEEELQKETVKLDFIIRSKV
tara:strand:+ start:9814 stop:10515 length:702 start_codon:yes stop_codon:yes gene_type:complete